MKFTCVCDEVQMIRNTIFATDFGMDLIGLKYQLFLLAKKQIPSKELYTA
jgi:hypothetical protein